MGRYVDGFVIPIAEKNVAAYRRMARNAGKVWMELGALAYVETVGDDTPYGKRTSFPRSVKLKEGETVIFSWIVYPTRAARDRINRKVMEDPRIQKMMGLGGRLVDGKRMIWGGFRAIVDL
jgi:uncharacterized protein YbaA (DUF1428 family)